MSLISIANLPPAVTPLSGLELIVLVQGGVTRETTIDNLPNVAQSFPALTGDVTSSAGIPVTTVEKIQGVTVSGVTGTGDVVFSSAPTLTGLLTTGYVTLTNSSVPANGFNIPAANTLGFSTNSTQRGVIDASGRFIWGGTSAISGIDFSLGGTPQVQFQTAGSGGANAAGCLWASYNNGASVSPDLFLLKSNGGSIGTHGINNSGDTLGQIYFVGDDGTNYARAGYILAQVEGSVSSGSGIIPTRLVFGVASTGFPVAALTIKSDRDIEVGSGSALATTATGGFLAISTCAGTPTGTPVNATTGLSQLIYNSSAQSLYGYDNTTSAWLNLTSGSSSFVWNSVTGTSQALSVNNGYVMDNSSLVTGTLPSTAAFGQIIRIAGQGTGGWKIAQNTGQFITFDGNVTTSGTGGSLSSTSASDCVELLCITTNTNFLVISSIGNLSGV